MEKITILNALTGFVPSIIFDPYSEKGMSLSGNSQNLGINPGRILNEAKQVSGL